MKKKLHSLILCLTACLLLNLCACSSEPRRILSPTLPPTAAPNPEKLHKITLSIENPEGGTAVLSSDSARYGDLTELTVHCNEDYKVESIKMNDRDLFLCNGAAKISGLTEDSLITVKFIQKRRYTANKVVPGSITATFYNKEATEYGISWHTEKNGSPEIKYRKAEGTDRNHPDFSDAETITGYTYRTAGNYANYGVIKNLEPNTEYLYVVGDAQLKVYGQVCSFKTKAERIDQFTFLHFSDTQDEKNFGTIWARGLKDAFAKYPDTAFVLNTGDMVQEGGKEELWNKILDLTGESLHRNILMYVSGNHDYWDIYLSGATKCAFSHFCIDPPNNQNVEEGMYYSVDYGDAHFVLLNTGDSEETGNQGLTNKQIEWLRNDLRSTDRTWKIVAMHNPMYSPGKYGSNPSYNGMALALRTQLNSVFSECGVDLVLTGHDHVYSRTYPISSEGVPLLKTKISTQNGIEYLINPQGPIHLASGTAGNQNRDILADLPEAEKKMFLQMQGTNPDHCSYSAITVEKNKLTVAYYDVGSTSSQSNLLYSWGIIKK